MGASGPDGAGYWLRAVPAVSPHVQGGRGDAHAVTHDSYAGVAEFPQPGPVYIHADDCGRFEGDGFPPELRALKLTFEGVTAGPRVIALERTDGDDVENVIERLLALPDVDYVNVRNTEAGCFVARVDHEHA